jgi:hypothetical protein
MSTVCPVEAVAATNRNDRRPSPESDASTNWSPLAQDIAIVAWPSFLVAAVATMLFFAFIDPLALRDATFPTWDIGRQTGYAIGFFFFWAVAAGASGVTLYLRETTRRRRRPDSGPPRR